MVLVTSWMLLHFVLSRVKLHRLYRKKVHFILQPRKAPTCIATLWNAGGLTCSNDVAVESETLIYPYEGIVKSRIQTIPPEILSELHPEPLFVLGHFLDHFSMKFGPTKKSLVAMFRLFIRSSGLTFFASKYQIMGFPCKDLFALALNMLNASASRP